MTTTTNEIKIASNFSLKIVYDMNASNPFDDWDCNPPLFTEGWQYFGNKPYNFWQDNPIRELLEYISDTKLARNFEKITGEIDGIDADDFDETIMIEWTKGEWLRDQLWSISITCDHIETLARIAKLSYKRWTSTGYAQGDSIDCISVLTPEYLTLTGSRPKHHEDILTGAQKLWDAYAWWEVYGYRIIEHKPLYTADGKLATETQDEIIDSCYGFYGEDWLKQIKDNLPEEHKHLFVESPIIY
jgi:hypothetical protein